MLWHPGFHLYPFFFLSPNENDKVFVHTAWAWGVYFTDDRPETQRGKGLGPGGAGSALQHLTPYTLRMEKESRKCTFIGHLLCAGCSPYLNLIFLRSG